MNKRLKAIAAFAIAIIITAGMLTYQHFSQAPQAPKEFKTAEEMTKDSKNNDTWEMDLRKDGLNNRAIDDGIPSIAQAKDEEAARESLGDWFAEVKKNPYLLAGYGSVILGKDIRSEDLFEKRDNKAFATTKAKEVADQLWAALSTMVARPASAEEVIGYNTGLSDGQVVRSENPVIAGDKTAIKIIGTLGQQKGKSYFILKRCGNLVTEEEVIPPGPTDQAEYARFKATKSWVNVPKNVTVPAVTFDLVRNDGKVVDSKVLKPGLTVVDFGDHIVKDLNGKRYSYTVREHVPQGYTMTKQGEWSFVNTYQTPTPEKKNPEMTSVTTRKIWVNEHLDPNAPTSVRITLLQDGKKIDSVRLDTSNNWQFTFRDLPVYDNRGNRHSYRVVEVDVPARYEVSYEGFDIINTYVKPKKVPPKLEPKSSNLKDYGAIQDAPKAPTTELTPPPTEYKPQKEESSILDRQNAPAPGLTAPGAIDNPGNDREKAIVQGQPAQTVVTKDSSGDVNKDITSNTADSKVVLEKDIPADIKPPTGDASIIGGDPNDNDAVGGIEDMGD